ncbi:MAG: hypothetical protein JNL83_25710 [Myxococcales bacterium]|nr:hypothetical protein [Myxococcales bacterium]
MIGAAIEVPRERGPGFREGIDQKALAYELESKKKHGIRSRPSLARSPR